MRFYGIPVKWISPFIGQISFDVSPARLSLDSQISCIVLLISDLNRSVVFTVKLVDPSNRFLIVDSVTYIQSVCHLVPFQ